MFGNIFKFEPFQVELFQDCLKNIKNNFPTMIELGCGEAEYSKIFNDYFSGKCENIGIDILPRQIESAKTICPEIKFIHGYVGEPVHFQEIVENNHGAKRIYIDDLLKDKKINILHMDIQGSETYVMEEIKDSKYINNIEYLFISLHNTYSEVKKCISNDFEYLFEHPTEGGLGDGLIVIKNKKF